MSSRSQIELIELGLIGAIFFFLPFKEAPKNILLFAYVCMWTAYSFRNGRWGTKDYVFEGPLILIVFLGIFGSCFIAKDIVGSLVDGIDFLTMTFIAIILRRSELNPGHILAVIFAATGIGIGVSVIEGWIFGYTFPSLRSVGHINHVAIFLFIFFTLALSLFFSARGVILSCGLLFLVLITLFLMYSTNSRNAVFSSVLVFIPMSAVMLSLSNRRNMFLKKILAGLLVMVAAAFTLATGSIEKQLIHISRGGLDLEREKLREAARVASQENLIIGYGVGNFAFATSEHNLRSILEKEAKTYKSDQYLHTNHAHNLFYNWLVERGLLAILLLYGWFIWLFTRACFGMHRYHSSVLESGVSHTASISKKCFVLILFSVPLSIVLMGFWNTTFHHEHGILAISAIAVAYRGLFCGRDRLLHSQNVSNAA